MRRKRSVVIWVPTSVVERRGKREEGRGVRVEGRCIHGSTKFVIALFVGQGAHMAGARVISPAVTALRLSNFR